LLIGSRTLVRYANQQSIFRAKRSRGHWLNFQRKLKLCPQSNRNLIQVLKENLN
jgi:hypothetical protein